ncbi:4-(cytidine 5'-diphospho)-2-C-methyl-D-erythritol kinase [Ancylobacter defluvii]|uniref:4-diphosphocytidyl-2-C-methyl-D-erythritol kinase n=1 Tax=Ancylobacter defluvii TaxID=1282440 RepID=A0A9W6NA65_9HYPH|nr:4-(cytidine 5'-diphospho)-2-C-methyl-D-erythritol kinase [Ancylobacter defluvii]MBS7590316.1 4-(cytidine 5'-diphospho)-2-C-methyl-D-erythritol kinase [Ancylobacter defluvii]GLK83232.1 4-diphosphocytidyl-2-C-methyl-D-erythritol kinase [Ancylobacter defluvii]
MPHPTTAAPTASSPPAARLAERAPAKINLSLAVLGRRADGYHELSSLVAFAGAADRLAYDPAGAPGLDLAGPGAATLAVEPDNLVLKAVRELTARVEGLAVGRFTLDKRLPVSSGIGGGSADAAAALRLLARTNGLAPDDRRMFEAALATGSDVPVCLYGRACLMRGRGEALTPVALPRFGLVLVNPRIPVATAAVFRQLGLVPGERCRSVPPPPTGFATRAEVLAFLTGMPNDLEPPARALEPSLGEVADRLAGTPAVRLVRMSGSGATFFGLYDDCRAAARAAKLIVAARPDWWVKSTIIG